MLLKSSRIYLRALKRSDAKSVFDAVQSSRAELDRFMAWSPHTRSVRDTLDYIGSTFTMRRRGTGYPFGIFDASTNMYLGANGLHDIRRSTRSAEIGYWIRSDQAGKGLATESSAILLRFAFEDLRVHRVVLRAAVDNVGSIKVAEKLGFLLGGVQRHEFLLQRGWIDFNFFVMLEDEYRQYRDRIESYLRS